MLRVLISQVGVFSATLPPEALEITRKFMNKPVSLSFLKVLYLTQSGMHCMISIIGP